jgi:hypothetical protein
MKKTLHQFTHYCVGCKEPLDRNLEIPVVEIRVGTLQHGVFNEVYNYPTQYVHEGCYEAYLEKKVELRREYASNSNQRTTT